MSPPVRSEERSIYTPSENPTVQIYVGSSDADPGTSDINIKYCSQRVRSPRVKVSVGTPGKRRDFRRSESRRTSGLPMSPVKQTASTADAGTPGLGQVSVGTPGERRDFRRAQTASSLKHRCRDSWLRSGLPTVGSSDLRRFFRH